MEERAYARGFGVKPLLEFDKLKNFVTCAKEVNYFRLLLLDNLST